MRKERRRSGEWSASVFLETDLRDKTRNQLKAKRLSMDLKLADASLFVALLISLLTKFDIGCSILKHGVVNARDFVSRRGHGLLTTGASLEAPVKST